MNPAEVDDLVAGYGGFCFGLFNLGSAVAVCVAVAVSIAIGRSDLHGLHGRARNGHLDLLHGADLHDGLLGLLQHQLFVNLADLGGFLEGLLAADAVFFGRGLRNIVLEVAHARGIFGVNRSECS